MNKKIIFPIILLIIILIVVLVVFLKKESQTKVNDNGSQQNQIILFYGDGCPHCAKVEKYIKENKIKEKLSFEEKEVYYNKNNAKELEEKAKICGMPTNSIGVPFLWDGSKCLTGDQDIINFLKEKSKEG